MPSLLVIDPEPLVAAFIGGFLERTIGAERVKITSCPLEAAKLAQRDQPQVVLMECLANESASVALISDIRKVSPNSALIMLTEKVSHACVARAVAAGFSGYVAKTSTPEELITSVRAALLGSSHFSHAAIAVMSRPETPHDNAGGLSAREQQVLQLLADGRTTNDIADELFVSRHTVRNHVRHIFSKLGCHSKLEAIVAGTQLGLTSLAANDDDLVTIG
jgi:DNA-binding NarL/FixJ family response regulator